MHKQVPTTTANPYSHMYHILTAAGDHPMQSARGLQSFNATALLSPLPDTGFQSLPTPAGPRPMLTVADPWFMSTTSKPHSTMTCGINACIVKTTNIEAVCFSLHVHY